MVIRFKDGKEIEFKQFGDIWLAESVIMEETELHDSMDELAELEDDITRWFDENAPEEIREKYIARLPMWDEIAPLRFKDQVAYREGKTDRIADYLLGDGDGACPVICDVGYTHPFGWYCRESGLDWDTTTAIRLCLGERK